MSSCMFPSPSPLNPFCRCGCHHSHQAPSCCGIRFRALPTAGPHTFDCPFHSSVFVHTYLAFMLSFWTLSLLFLLLFLLLLSFALVLSGPLLCLLLALTPALLMLLMVKFTALPMLVRNDVFCKYLKTD